MTFQTYIPTGPLGEFVDSIYFISGKESGTGVAFPRMHQVIIINLGTHFLSSDVYTPATIAPRETNTAVWMNGKQDNPFLLENPGTTAMYAIGIKLGMMPYFADLPAIETNNQTVSAENWTSKNIFSLREQLYGCASITDGFLLIEQYLLNSLKGRNFWELDRVKWLGKAMYTHTVEEMCSTLGMTRKRLRSEAQHYFGDPIKNIQGIIRLNRTLTTIANSATTIQTATSISPNHTPTTTAATKAKPSPPSLSSLHEYFDQSHFIHDFKARTGITPRQYRRLVQQFPFIANTPNFIALPRETFLQFISGPSQ